MKRKLLTLTLITSLTASLLAGCGCARKVSVTQKSDTQTIEVGSDYSFDVNEFFDSKSKITDKDYTLDATNVDTTKLGEYEITVNFSGKEYKITVLVKDTVAPALTAKEDYFTFGDLSKVNWAECFTVEDKTSVTYTYVATKLGNAAVINDDTITKYLVNHEADEAVNDETDGYYKVTVTAEDEGKNTTSVDVYATVDTTAPVATFNGSAIGESVTYKDGQLFSDLIKISDAMSGEILFDEATWTLDGENATLSCADKAGNALNLSFVVKKQAASTGSSSSGNNSSSSGNSSSGSSSGSTSGSTGSTGTGLTDDITQSTGAIIDHVQDNGTVIYGGWVDLGNGYKWKAGGGREHFLKAYEEAQHLNTLSINQDDYWTVWVTTDCPSIICKHGKTIKECNESTQRIECDIRDAISQIADRYVKSLYGEDYKGYVNSVSGTLEDFINNSTGEVVFGCYGHDIAVICPDGVKRCLETDNSIINLTDGSVWKTPN